MKYSILALFVIFNFSACTEQKTNYDGAELLQQKCSACHNLDMPPKTYENEKAPPMMAVAFHVKDFMQISSESEKRPKFIDFFKDFVLHPSVEKSFCDKESLKSYGLMPSQKGKVTKEEIGAIAEYVFDFYDQDKFLKQMKEKSAFDALPKGEQLIKKKGCLTCHDILKSKVAPSFVNIAKKSKTEIISVIQNGSKGEWKGFERMMMPAYKDIFSDKELEDLVKWMQTL